MTRRTAATSDGSSCAGTCGSAPIYRPLKVETRVRTPLGLPLPRRCPRRWACLPVLGCRQKKVPHHLRTWTAGSVFVAFAALAACSSGPTTDAAPNESTAPSAADDFEAWRAAEAAVCNEFEPRLTARSDELGEPGSLQEAAAYFDVMAPLNNEYIAALLDVPAPETRGSEVERLNELTRQLKATARTAQAAAHFNDEPSFSEAIQELDALGDESDQLLTELDLPECITEERSEA